MVMFQPVEPLPLSASTTSTSRTQSQADLDDSLELSRSKRQRQQEIHQNSIGVDDMQMEDTVYSDTSLQSEEIPDKDEVLLQVRFRTWMDGDVGPWDLRSDRQR